MVSGRFTYRYRQMMELFAFQTLLLLLLLMAMCQSEEIVISSLKEEPHVQKARDSFPSYLSSTTVKEELTNSSKPTESATAVLLDVQDDHVVIDNGILLLTLTNPGGNVKGIKYGGIDNLLSQHDQEDGGHNQKINVGGYWNVNWNDTGSQATRFPFDSVCYHKLRIDNECRIEGTSFSVIVKNEEQVEVSFTRSWDPSMKSKHAPLKIDKRYIVLQGSSGFYCYGIFEHLQDMPAFNLSTARIAFMLQNDKFHYMAITDNRQRLMPSPDDRLKGRGQKLAYPEAVLIYNPLEPEFKGEVDDKYQYSCLDREIRVHGWICGDPPVGFWQITPSNEFRTGGPFKQDLTSHVGPATLAIFVTPHYAGPDLMVKFKAGEMWKKVFGPVFIYLNSASDKTALWNNANEQMNAEVQSWPYNFPASEDFPKSDQRGTVTGRLLVQDRHISKESILANGAYVGLAPLGNAGSWQRECKGYQFWTTADEGGNFIIKNIRVGHYNLYASVPGFIGDYKYDVDITIIAGSKTNMGDIVYVPPRDGPTLWEIGVPDRSAAEFFVPDPNPKYINKLYVNHLDRFRQYGLWERYTDLFPNEDLVFTIGTSDYRKDWFFTQVTRKTGNDTYEATTWQIKFKLEGRVGNRAYKLRLAIASAHESELQVRVNDEKSAKHPLFSSGVIGGDNAVARHGIHGVYWLFSVDVPSSNLKRGNNTIYLTQAKHSSPFQGIMYDYIRLEGPSSGGRLMSWRVTSNFCLFVIVFSYLLI